MNSEELAFWRAISMQLDDHGVIQMYEDWLRDHETEEEIGLIRSAGVDRLVRALRAASDSLPCQESLGRVTELAAVANVLFRRCWHAQVALADRIATVKIAQFWDQADGAVYALDGVTVSQAAVGPALWQLKLIPTPSMRTSRLLRQPNWRQSASHGLMIARHNGMIMADVRLGSGPPMRYERDPDGERPGQWCSRLHPDGPPENTENFLANIAQDIAVNTPPDGPPESAADWTAEHWYERLTQWPPSI